MQKETQFFYDENYLNDCKYKIDYFKILYGTQEANDLVKVEKTNELNIRDGEIYYTRKISENLSISVYKDKTSANSTETV